MFFLIGKNPDGPSADAGVSAKKRFAVFRAVLFELARIHDSRDDFFHIVLFRRIAGEKSVHIVGRMQWVARLYMAERRDVWRADFVNQGANSRDAGVVIRLT